MKKIIFIDWDGTICFSRFWESLSSKNSLFAQVVTNFFASEKNLIRSWMIGKHTSEEINKILSKKVGLSEKEVWQSFVSDCKNMQFDNNISKIIQELRKKYTVILITGNMDCFSRFTVPSLKLNDLFDYIVNSYETGLLKTDDNGKTFFDCFKIFKSDITNAYLIDDSISTCKLFNALGGKALKVNKKSDVEIYLNKLLHTKK